jgi:hypothetical protein
MKLAWSIGRTCSAKWRNVLDKHEHVLFLSLAIQDAIKNSPENNRLSTSFGKLKAEFSRNNNRREEKVI